MSYAYSLYSRIPSKPPEQLIDRLFIILPESSNPILKQFLPNSNSIAPDEIAAHIGMFEARSNDSYYQLGLDTSSVIHDAVLSQRHRPSEEIKLEYSPDNLQDSSNAETSSVSAETNLVDI